MDEAKPLKEIISNAESLAEDVCKHPAIQCSTLKMETDDMKHHFDHQETTTTNSYLFEQIGDANVIIQEIDTQVCVIDKAVRSSYSRRFPELTVANSKQYFQVVKLLRNNPSIVTDEQMKDRLAEILDPQVLFLVVMTAATTQGTKLEGEEMEKVLQASTTALKLIDLRLKLLNFVQSNMTKIAPNLSIVLGASVAAKLVSRAGGLSQLATMPACNISLIGASKITSLGVSSVEGSMKMGYVYFCDLVQRVPIHHTKDVRKRAVRLLISKCVLAARCDISQSHPDGSFGAQLREDIEKKINKELEPPPKKAARPLPAPIDKASKKRGGKRVRRMKERYAESELRRAKNRINFGDIGDDVYQQDMKFSRTQLGSLAYRASASRSMGGGAKSAPKTK